jgi:hypothetical protein
LARKACKAVDFDVRPIAEVSGPSTVGHRMGTDLHRVARMRTLSGLLRASPRDLCRRWSEGPPPTTTSVLWLALSSNTYLARGMLAPPPKARASPAHDRDPCFVRCMRRVPLRADAPFVVLCGSARWLPGAPVGGSLRPGGLVSGAARPWTFRGVATPAAGLLLSQARELLPW